MTISDTSNLASVSTWLTANQDVLIAGLVWVAFNVPFARRTITRGAWRLPRPVLTLAASIAGIALWLFIKHVSVWLLGDEPRESDDERIKSLFKEAMYELAREPDCPVESSSTGGKT